MKHKVKNFKNLNGLFRVKGVFEGKARICEIKVVDSGTFYDNGVFFTPINPEMHTVYLSYRTALRKLKSDSISIMCVERF